MLTLSINGTDLQVDVPEDMPLLWVLRAGAHRQQVRLRYRPVRRLHRAPGWPGGARLRLAGRRGEGPQGGDHRTHRQHGLGRKVQQAWLEDEVVQCGYCQCGQIMSAVALLEQNPQPDDRAIDQGMAGNLCRCCTYTRIRSAIKRVAQA